VAALALLLTGLPILLNGQCDSRFPPYRIFEFFIGMSLGLAYSNHVFESAISRFRKASAVIASAFFAAMVLLPLFLSWMPILGQTSFLLYGLLSAGFLFIVANLDRLGTAMPFLTHPTIVLGGEISYSFYLFHNLLFRYLKGFAQKVLGQNIADWPLPVQIGSSAFVFALTLLISWLVFRHIETPGRKKIRSFLLPNPVPAPVPTSALQ